MNPFRRSYEARVLVVPLGSGGARVVEDLGAAGVEGVRVLTAPDAVAAQTTPIGAEAWEPPAEGSTAEVTESADMVVLVGSDLSDVPEDVVRVVCESARNGGDLVAAVLVAPRHWESPAGASAMRTLRHEVDMLVQVRGPRLLAALVDVLRGGTRTVDDEPPQAEEIEVYA